MDEAARIFAVERHGDQRYDQDPYETHLAAVVAVLRTWTNDAELLQAAWLHDTLEDTATTFEELQARFGKRVADLVWAVTAEGESRADKMSAIYRKIAQVPDAAIVKLADRVANVEAAPAASRHRERYVRERESFSDAIRPHVPEAAWARMEAAFKA